MIHVPAIVVVILFWSLLYVGDFILKNYTRLSRAYRELLDGNGVSFSFGHIRWYTTSFNHCFTRCGIKYPTIARAWFTVGACFGILMMFVSVGVLSWTLTQALVKSSPEQVIMPVMPGVNLPWSHITYYLLTLTVAGVVHEIGHALGAVREHVRVNGFGIFFMVLYPGAFVDLFTEHLAVISPVRQLRIYCGGIWHNFILALIAGGLLWLLPNILLLGYTANQGAVILDLKKGSAIEDSLVIGDHITSIDNCAVRNLTEWKSCLKQTIIEAQHGFCTNMMVMTRKNSFFEPGNFVSKNVEDCCGNLTASRHCFSFESTSGQKGLSCLPARTMMSDEICSVPKDCSGRGEQVCIRPSVKNSTRLIKISHYKGKDILYLGDPRIMLYEEVIVGNYLPITQLSPLYLPLVLETFLMYIISFSSALALLNAAPCYWLDGQWILYAFVDLTLSKSIPDVTYRNSLCKVVLTAGTFLLGSNIVLALWTLGNIT